MMMEDCNTRGLMVEPTFMRRVKRHILVVIILALIVLTTSGCGGINASGGVSPASFLVPGLL